MYKFMVGHIPYQPTRHPYLYDTDSYLISTVAVQCGEASDDTLAYLLSYYSQDRDLVRMASAEVTRRQRLCEEV